MHTQEYTLAGETFSYPIYKGMVAVCVKYYGPDPKPRSEPHKRFWEGLTEKERYRIAEHVRENVQESWWYNIREFVRDRSLSAECHGRQGGWLLLVSSDTLAEHEYDWQRDPTCGWSQGGRAACYCMAEHHVPREGPLQVPLFHDNDDATRCVNCNEPLRAHPGMLCGVTHLGAHYVPHSYEHPELYYFRMLDQTIATIEAEAANDRVAALLQDEFDYRLDEAIADAAKQSAEEVAWMQSLYGPGTPQDDVPGEGCSGSAAAAEPLRAAEAGA